MNAVERAADLAAAGEPAAMLTVVGTEGSAPRNVGTKMVVTAQETYGTIGGGTVEGLAIEAAREVLAREADPGVRTYDLEPGGNTGMVCGGSMDVFVDRMDAAPLLYVAGAGHIGRELAPLADQVGYDVTVVDDREEYADPEAFPDSVEVVRGDYREEIAGLPTGEGAAVAVATRSGTFDARAVGAAIDGGAGYVGLVASEDKTDHVLDSLADEGYSRTELARVRAPVGLDLGGGSPADIALSILAEVNADRHGASRKRETKLDLDDLVVVRGGGDLGSGAVYRLHRAGYPVVVTEVEAPTVVRRAVAFGAAMYESEVEVEGVVGRAAETPDEVLEVLADGDVPVLADPEADIADELDAAALVDATMVKGRADTGTRRGDADTVVGLGPGFVAGDADADPPAEFVHPVDAVVETDRGHELGRVVYEGTVSPYDGEPGERKGFTTERVLRSSAAGEWTPTVEIGAEVESGQVVGRVGDEPVKTEIAGLVRGLVHDGVTVNEGAKLGDVDPREGVDYTKISDKALCLGGGVLEALLRLD